MNFISLQMERDAIFTALEKKKARSCSDAVIYYREISDWTQKHTVYPFDYVEEPDIDTSKGVETRIRFYISEEQVKVAWTSYESVGNGNWEYLEKIVYEIPLTENDPIICQNERLYMVRSAGQ